jgi:hypothetical protein
MPGKAAGNHFLKILSLLPSHCSKWMKGIQNNTFSEVFSFWNMIITWDGSDDECFNSVLWVWLKISETAAYKGMLWENTHKSGHRSVLFCWMNRCIYSKSLCLSYYGQGKNFEWTNSYHKLIAPKEIYHCYLALERNLIHSLLLMANKRCSVIEEIFLKNF